MPLRVMKTLRTKITNMGHVLFAGTKYQDSKCVCAWGFAGCTPVDCLLEVLREKECRGVVYFEVCNHPFFAIRAAMPSLSRLFPSYALTFLMVAWILVKGIETSDELTQGSNLAVDRPQTTRIGVEHFFPHAFLNLRSNEWRTLLKSSLANRNHKHVLLPCSS